MVEFDVNALGQAIDTTWGRSSTKTGTCSIKFKLEGNVLKAHYGSVVNFASEFQLQTTKRKYSELADDAISKVLKSIKSTYKSLAGSTLTLKELEVNEYVEVVGSSFHNPKKTAIFHKNMFFEVS